MGFLTGIPKWIYNGSIYNGGVWVLCPNVLNIYMSGTYANHNSNSYSDLVDVHGFEEA